MDRKNERTYYDSLSSIFENELESNLGSDWSVVCVNNTGSANLRTQVNEICERLKLHQLGGKFPEIFTDLVIGITNGDGQLRLAKIEVKGPAKNLSLQDYSQLVGYLQVAGLIQVGALLLIEQETIPSPVSGDLKKLINSGRLLVEWDVSSRENNRLSSFKTGICSYVPNGLVDWVDLRTMGGISKWSELAQAIKASEPI
jgi:hypothetical protein